MFVLFALYHVITRFVPRSGHRTCHREFTERVSRPLAQPRLVFFSLL